MAFFLAIRRVRHLSTAAAVAVALKPVTMSYTKSRLNMIHNPVEFLKFYSSVSTSNDGSTHPAKSKKYSGIESFLEAHKSNTQINQETFLASLIKSYGEAGLFENALKTYNKMSDMGTPQTVLSFNSLLSACVHAKEFDRVPAFFSELPKKFGFLPDKISYGCLIRSYCEMGSPETAIEKLNEMEEKGLHVDAIVFTTILNGLYENGKSDEVEKFWDKMVKEKGVRPDIGSFNARLVRIVEPEGFQKLIEEMKKVGLTPNIVSYNYMITYYCEKGMMDETEKVYNELLKARACTPNTETFRTLVVYMCKHGRFLSGYEVFKESVKLRKIPDIDTLKILLEGLVKEERMNEAEALVKTMLKQKLPSDSLEAWRKLAEDLRVANVATEESVDSGEIENLGILDRIKNTTI